ncbi:hypothetical protein [Lacticaseibacillus rhamnosus]|uniref:hypothetical protein n=1 Tax=Lacticaseibacillus rhamnosus TaxID=47715 RepID=UPI001CDCD26F|nr:hypothetical protein [Lacticaseibacillus rhamnosus]
MADEAVLAVQKWLNKTYSSVSGFTTAPENGQTGWPTIYSLRMGLQHEIGISAIGEGFGDATKTALASVVGSLKPGYKAISPSSFKAPSGVKASILVATLIRTFLMQQSKLSKHYSRMRVLPQMA